MVWLMKLKELADRVLGEDQRAKHLREEELQLAAAALLVRHLPFDLHTPGASCPPLPCRDCEPRQHAPRGDDAGAGPPKRGLGLCSDPEAPPARRDAMAVAAAPYIHSKLPQVDGTPHHKQTITSVRFLTEEEWLARRDAQQGNSRLITSDVSDADVIDEQEEH